MTKGGTPERLPVKISSLLSSSWFIESKHYTTRQLERTRQYILTANSVRMIFIYLNRPQFYEHYIKLMDKFRMAFLFFSRLVECFAIYLYLTDKYSCRRWWPSKNCRVVIFWHSFFLVLFVHAGLGIRCAVQKMIILDWICFSDAHQDPTNDLLDI